MMKFLIERFLRGLYGHGALSKLQKEEINYFNGSITIGKTTLDEFESIIRYFKHEFVGIFFNNILVESFSPMDTFSVNPRANLENECSFYLKKCVGMHDITLTHNHPMGGPLSPADIKLAILSNFVEVRATNINGTWISKCEKGFKTCDLIVVERLQKSLELHSKEEHKVFNQSLIDDWLNDKELMALIPLQFIPKE